MPVWLVDLTRGDHWTTAEISISVAFTFHLKWLGMWSLNFNFTLGFIALLKLEENEFKKILFL